MDAARLKAELKWLQEHPQFEERPATIREFVGEHYLNIEKRMRPAIMRELEQIMGTTIRGDRITAYQLAMITGGIGIGKTTIASVVLPYLAHWVLCLKDPQGFFNLLPGSRIAFMQMSTSGKQAEEVVFGDIFARIQHSTWFQTKYPYDSKFKKQIRFPQKDIWILPGDSAETTFEGYNILGGILDEADSHKVTENKDYAEQGYTTIFSRIHSRFAAVEGDDGVTRSFGFLLVIGQMKKANGFAARKFKEFSEDPDAYAVRMAIWESFGWERYLNPDGTRDSFFYDTKRKEIVPAGAAKLLGGDKSKNLIEIPNMYRGDFLNKPEKALRDLAGIPPATGSPFISLGYKVEECRERWIKKNKGLRGPIKEATNYLPKFESWFRAPDTLRRVCHIDMAYSANGDGLGFAMGHVYDVVEVDGERKPMISFDLLMRIHAPAGTEIFLGDVRRIIYQLKDELGFKIHQVTMDGFQSTDTRQQLERRRIITEIVSVDKQIHPYHDLREAIYEDRIMFPEYMVKLRPDDTDMVEIAVKELTELTDNATKVDHPEGGSKDVADSMAGVVYTLMGERSYHKKAVAPSVQHEEEERTPESYRVVHPLYGTGGPATAPLPPTGAMPTWRPPTNR